jgi:hypothetical protein
VDLQRGELFGGEAARAVPGQPEAESKLINNGP